MSHIGIARDLFAVLNLNGEQVAMNKPSVDARGNKQPAPIQIEVKILMHVHVMLE